VDPDLIWSVCGGRLDASTVFGSVLEYSSGLPGALFYSRAFMATRWMIPRLVLVPTAPPRGACHRRLAAKWWPLPDPPAASPGGPPSMFLQASVVTAVSPTDNTPRGARHRCLHRLSGGHCRTRRQHPIGGPPSMSSSTKW
jgi:hypothetical protein